MQTQWLGKTMSALLTVARKSVGVMLVMTAFAGTAFCLPPDVPEIDPGSLTSALTLLAGGVLMLVAAKGTHILVRANGPDAEAAYAAIEQLVKDKFGEH